MGIDNFDEIGNDPVKIRSERDDQLLDLKRRLARVEGQVRGISKMLDESRKCKDIVTQISAVSKALDQIGFRLIASQMTHCLGSPQEALEEGNSLEEVEKLFLKIS